MANIGKMAAQMTLDSVGFEKSAAKTIGSIERMKQSIEGIKKIASGFGALELLGRINQAWDRMQKATEGTQVGEQMKRLDDSLGRLTDSFFAFGATLVSIGTKNVDQFFDNLANRLNQASQGIKEFVDNNPLAGQIIGTVFPAAGIAGAAGSGGKGKSIGGAAGKVGAGLVSGDAAKISKLMDDMEKSVESKRLDALGIGPNVRKVLEEAPRTSTDEFNKLVEAAELADKKIAQIAERMEKMKQAGKEFVEGVTAPIKAIMERSKLRVEQEGKFKDEVGRAMDIANRLTEFKTPSAILEGSTEAFSAINRFQNQGTGRASMEDVKKILEEQRNIEKEQKRLLEEAVKALKDQGVPIVSI